MTPESRQRGGDERWGEHVETLWGLRSHARSMSAEEWVARFSHQHMLLGPFAYRYADPDFDRWMGEVEALLRDWRGRRALRERYLTPDEISAVEAAEREDF